MAFRCGKPMTTSDIATSQEPVFAFLMDPATHGGAAVKRVDTHAAVVFLAGERALKLKRAVQFPFLDYSTLAKRKAACEAEIEVNRPYAAELYRGVVAITREADGRLAIAGKGEPIEYAVEMRRFDETQTLDRLAADGRIDAPLADAIGRAVAAAHARTPTVPSEPWIAALGSYIAEHEAAFQAIPTLFDPAANERLARSMGDAFSRTAPLLAERGRRSLIRRIHGDLHLGNIALIDGRPMLFDAIEFSDIIASGDLLYDLAFVLMDLTERGLGAAANIVFNRYHAETRRDEDLDALAALPFYLSMRASIRAKVTAARLDQADEVAKPTIARNAGAYFDWALRFIAPPPPALIAIGGLSGTGKSALARMLAPAIGPAPGAVVLRSDVERKALFGKAETEPLPAEAYTPTITLRVYCAIADKARRALAAGHSAIVDAVFAAPGEREGIEKSAAALSVPFHGLFLVADLETRLARVGTRRGDASDADAAIARNQERYDLGTLGWTRIDASGSPEETLARAQAALRLQPSP
jgi:aminoglycoside phosphotransferase family enzyme/predicted kinase